MLPAGNTLIFYSEIVLHTLVYLPEILSTRALANSPLCGEFLSAILSSYSRSYPNNRGAETDAKNGFVLM